MIAKDGGVILLPLPKLALVGYFLGSNQAMIHQEMRKISLCLIAACAVLIVIYIFIYRRRQHK